MPLLANTALLTNTAMLRNTAMLTNTALLTNSGQAAESDTYLMARQHILWPALATASAGTWANYGDGTTMFGGGTFNGSPSGAGDYLEFPATAFSPGDYRISVLCHTLSSRGILHLSIGGVDTGARVDMYSGSTLLNQVVTATFTLGSKTFGAPRLTVGSKNASASNYIADILQCAIIKTSAGDDKGADGDDLPWVIDVPLMSSSANSGGWTTVIATAHYRGTIIYSDYANGSWIEWKAWIPAGTWDLHLIRYRGPSEAILQLSLDGAAAGTLDLYGSSTMNHPSSISGITVAETRIYTVRLSANGKNGSSGSYGINLNDLQFRRTA